MFVQNHYLYDMASSETNDFYLGEMLHAVAIPKQFCHFQFLWRDQLAAVFFYRLSISPYHQPLYFQQHSVLDSSYPDYLHIPQK